MTTAPTARPRSTPPSSRWRWRPSGRAGCCPVTPTSTRRCWSGSARTSSAAGSASVAARMSPSQGASARSRSGQYGVLLPRDEGRRARAFENACRHRGHELLPCGGVGRRRAAIVCPYHAWSYRHDGSLIGAPDFKDVETFDKHELGLKPVPLQEWHGWVFVDAVRRRWGLRRAHRRARGDRRAVRRRVTGDSRDPRVRRRGQLEGHRRELPGVLPLLDDPPRAVPRQPADERGEHRARGQLGRRLDGPAPGRRDDVARRHAAAAWRWRGSTSTSSRTVMYVAVLPNLLISLHPDYVMTHLLVPLAPNRTRITCSWAFPPAVVARAGLRPGVRRGLLGPHQPPGLGRLRVGAARAAAPSSGSRARSPPRRTASTTSSPSSRTATWVANGTHPRRSRSWCPIRPAHPGRTGHRLLDQREGVGAGGRRP